MKKLILLILLFPILIFSQNEESNKFVGFEIFLLEGYKGNHNSLRYFTKKQSRKFFKKIKKIKKIDEIPDSTCHDYLNWSKITLSKKPFLSKSDIEYYYWDTYTIVLTNSGIEKMKSLEGDVYGVPFTITINGEVQFGGKFSYIYSSHANDRVYTRVEIEPKELKLEFLGCGKDPRNTIDFKSKLTIKD